VLLHAGIKLLPLLLQQPHSRRLRQLLPEAALLQAAWAALGAHLQCRHWTLLVQLQQQRVVPASHPPGLAQQWSAARQPAGRLCAPARQQAAAQAGASSQQHLCEAIEQALALKAMPGSHYPGRY
jgi:hypothetical protein